MSPASFLSAPALYFSPFYSLCPFSVPLICFVCFPIPSLSFSPFFVFLKFFFFVPLLFPPSLPSHPPFQFHTQAMPRPRRDRRPPCRLAEAAGGLGSGGVAEAAAARPGRPRPLHITGASPNQAGSLVVHRRWSHLQAPDATQLGAGLVEQGSVGLLGSGQQQAMWLQCAAGAT